MEMKKDDLVERANIERMVSGAIKLLISIYNEVTKGKISSELEEKVIYDEFEIRPYCYCNEEGCENCENPNFFYKKNNLMVSWYKNIGRSMDINCDQEVKPSMLLNMLMDCSMEIIVRNMGKTNKEMVKTL